MERAPAMPSSTEKRHYPRIPPGLEKRKHQRIPLDNVTVEVYNAAGDAGTPEVCPILNLSESGMLFETHNEYVEESSLRLTFMLPDTIVIIRTDAEVVHQFWKRETGFVGVQFGKIGVPEKSCIRTFVQKHQLQEN
jgi:hypothetical protein